MALSPKQLAVKALFPHIGKMIASAIADVDGLADGRGGSSRLLKGVKAKEQIHKICAPFVAKMEKLADQKIGEDADDGAGF